jgi:archaellum biogenesis ATPase FlaH
MQVPLVITLGESFVDICKRNGVKHCIDATNPGSLLSDGQVRSDVAMFGSYIILINRGWEEWRDTVAVALGDERCRWAYFPEDPAEDVNIPVILSGAKRMWTDELARLSDIPDPGPQRTYRTGFRELDDYGWRIVTPAFMPIVGPYGSGKSIFLRQLLVNLWKMHGWKFALTAFEEKVKPRYQRDMMRHLIGTVESTWTDEQRAQAQEELDEAALFILRKRNTLLDVDRLIDRIEYAARVYETRVVAIDPFNEIDHFVPRNMSKTDYVGEVIMRLKQLADDYNLLMIVALHPPKDGVEKRLQKRSVLTLNDGADSANWGNKADIGLTMWRKPNNGPTILNIDKLKDHETMGRPTLVELAHNPALNKFGVAQIGDDILNESEFDA